MNNSGSKYLLLLFLFFLSASDLFAQKGQGMQMLLSDYLKKLESRENIFFSYDDALLEGVLINVDTTNLNLDNALTLLSKESAFQFEKINDSQVLVKPKKPGANFRLCGVVVDPEAKETLPGVSIFNEAKNKGTITDADGRFEEYFNIKDFDKIHIYYLGYELKTISISDVLGKGCITIELKQIELTAEAVIQAYLAPGIDYKFKTNSIEVNPNGLGLLPGETDQDILMAIEALPGINTPDSKAGNLNIRGSSSDQTLIVFDNIPIYHKGHYFGTFSPYNPAAIDNVSVQRSAYTADKGGRVGGAIEITSKKNIPDSVRAGIGISTTYSTAYTQIPVIKNKLGLLLAGRSAYPFHYVSPKLKAINNFLYQQTELQEAAINPSKNFLDQLYYFNDVNAKVIAKPGRKDDFEFSVLKINNRVLFDILDTQSGIRSYDKMLLNNFGFNAGWNRYWNDRTSTSVTVTQSYYVQRFFSQLIERNGNLTENNLFSNELRDLDLKAQTSYKIKYGSINAGWDMRKNNQKYLDYTFANPQDNDIAQITESYTNSGFLNFQFAKNNYLINSGVRANYYNVTKRIYLEPRLMGNYFLSDNWALKASAGIYNQYVLQVPGFAIESVGGIENGVWMIADGGNIPVVNSKQIMAGAVFQKGTFIIDAEFYYKNLSGLSINNLLNFSSNYFLHGTGKTEGLDLLLKKQWKRFDAWVSYTLSKSTMHFDSLYINDFPSIFDQRHIFDIVGTYKIKRWKFSAGWKYRTGFPALPELRTRWLHGAPSFGPNQTPPPPQPLPPGGHPTVEPSSVIYTDRFPSFHQMDVSIVYLLPKGSHRWNASIGLSLNNVYNQKNLIEQIPQRMSNGQIVVMNKYGIGFAPNLMVNINW